MAWISFRRLALQEKKNLMTARVSMLLKSRASLTCFRVCFLPCRAKDLSAALYIACLVILKLFSVLTAVRNIAININADHFQRIYISFFLWRCGPTRAMASSFLRFLDHTQRRITVGRTPLDEWSARLRDLYLTTHNTHNRQISKPPVGFEPTISAGEWTQTYALDHAATGTGKEFTWNWN